MKKYIIVALVCLSLCSELQSQEAIVRVSFTNRTFVRSGDAIMGITLGAPFGFAHLNEGLIVMTGLPIFFAASDTTSVIELPPLEGIQVYPNPITDLLTLNRKAVSEKLRVKIYNSSGQELRQLNWEENVETLKPNFLGYSAGTYIVEITDENFTRRSQYKILKR